MPGLEGMVTDTVIGQIQQDGTYKVVNSNDNADAVLVCIIEKLQRTPERSVTGNVLLTSEFDLDLGVRYTLAERATGKILDSGRLDGQTTFFRGQRRAAGRTASGPAGGTAVGRAAGEPDFGRVLKKGMKYEGCRMQKSEGRHPGALILQLSLSV